jgi:uncharacterized protein YegP (UPF0339 family)
MSRAPRFEICRGDDGWWARFRAANGRVVWVTETYERRQPADRAVLILAGWNRSTTAMVKKVLLGDTVVEVREVDERV